MSLYYVTINILLGRWGTLEHQPLLERIVARLADGTQPQSGRTAWLGLRWYPIMLLLYSGGIAALSANNYATLLTLFATRLRGSNTGQKSQPALVSVIDGILDVDRLDVFKILPGFEKYYVPRSEYLFKTLQPELEDLLFLGNGYEDLFDRFEIFYALAYLDWCEKPYVWAPPGRFGWKGRHGGGPYNDIVNEAKQSGDTWAPISAGLFSRSIERFSALSKSFYDEVLTKLPAW